MRLLKLSRSRCATVAALAPMMRTVLWPALRRRDFWSIWSDPVSCSCASRPRPTTRHRRRHRVGHHDGRLCWRVCRVRPCPTLNGIPRHLIGDLGQSRFHGGWRSARWHRRFCRRGIRRDIGIKPRDAPPHLLLPFAAGLAGKGSRVVSAATTTFFVAFGFLASRPLRFCPLAIAACPFRMCNRVCAGLAANRHMRKWVGPRWRTTRTGYICSAGGALAEPTSVRRGVQKDMGFNHATDCCFASLTRPQGLNGATLVAAEVDPGDMSTP